MNKKKRAAARMKRAAFLESRVVTIEVQKLSRIHDSLTVDLDLTNQKKMLALSEDEQYRVHGLLGLLLLQEGQTWSGEIEVDRRTDKLRVRNGILK